MNPYKENTLSLDSNKCTGCGMCAMVCPHRVFELMEKKAVPVLRELCMECGACQSNCPEGAISVSNGVGCAAAMIIGALTGKEPSC